MSKITNSSKDSVKVTLTDTSKENVAYSTIELPKPKVVDIDFGLGPVQTEIYEAKDVEKLLRVLKAVQDENESLRKMQGMTLFEIIDSRIEELKKENKELREENKLLKQAKDISI